MFDFVVFEKAGLSGDPETLTLSHPKDTLTVREIVGLKVREQHERLKTQPGVADLPLNRLRPKDAEALIEQLIEKTCNAVTGYQVFLFVDGRQITDLDEDVPIAPVPQIEFIRLVPLKGG